MTIEDAIAEYFAERNRITVGRFLRFRVRNFHNDNSRRPLPASGGDALLSRVRPRQLTDNFCCRGLFSATAAGGDAVAAVRPRQLANSIAQPPHDGPHGLCFSGVSEPFIHSPEVSQ